MLRTALRPADFAAYIARSARSSHEERSSAGPSSAAPMLTVTAPTTSKGRSATITRIFSASPSAASTVQCRIRMTNSSPPQRTRTSDARRYPLLLAMAAREHVRATLEGTRRVYRDLRAQLRDFAGPEDIQAGLQALEGLAAQFSRTVREVELVEQALRGKVWKPRL